MTQAQHTPGELDALRKEYGIPAHFVPVATAPGVIAWGTPPAKARGEA